MKIFPVRDGPGQRKRAHCVPAAGSPHFLSNNKQPSFLSALSGCQRLTVGQGSAGCIDPVIYITTEEAFNECPFVLAGQEPRVPCDVRRTESRNDRSLSVSVPSCRRPAGANEGAEDYIGALAGGVRSPC